MNIITAILSGYYKQQGAKWITCCVSPQKGGGKERHVTFR
jgi:hypothetical protein